MKRAESRDLFEQSGFPIKVNAWLERPWHRQEFHEHDHYEILLVEEGSVLGRFNGCEIHLKSRDVLIMNPDVLHLFESSASNTSYRAISCSFMPQAVDSGIKSLKRLKDLSSPNRYFFKTLVPLMEKRAAAVLLNVDPQNYDNLIMLFRRLKKTSHGRGERDRALTRYYFLRLLAFLSEQYERGANRNTIKVDRTEPVPI